jgi:hypothetical protein
MRHTMLMTAAVLCLGAAPALAQGMNPTTGARPGHEPGVGYSEPASGQASHTDSSNARSTIAPRLPTPPVGADADAASFLHAAQRDLDARRTGAAQEALERAETRLLDRSTDPSQVNAPDRSPTVDTIEQARQALGRHDISGARELISRALSETASSARPPM